MSKRLPWGHESRHCVHCGKVGPRVQVFGGYSHKYCLTDDERHEHAKKLREGTYRA